MFDPHKFDLHNRLVDSYCRMLFAFTLGFILTNAMLNPAEAETAKKTLRIGWSGPLTGNSAILGVDSARAVRMVFDTANADPQSRVQFEFITEDDGYNTKRSVIAYHKLVSVDQVPLMFFLTYGGLFAAAPLAEHDNVLLIDPLDCNEAVAKLPSHTLCIAAMTEGIGRLNAESALRDGNKKAAILFFEDDPFMSTVAKSTEEKLRAGGATVLLNEAYLSSQSDFRSLLLRVKAANADSLYIYGYDEAAIVMKQARQMGLNLQFYTTATVMSPPFVAAAGNALEGTKFSVFSPSDKATYDDFISKFTAKYGTPPTLDIATIPSFDVANIIVGFARSFQGDFDSPKFIEALRRHLYDLKNYKGASGEITVDADGATRSLTLRTYQVRGGKKVLQP